MVKKGDRFGRNRQFLVSEMTPQRLIVRQGEDPRPIVLSLVEQAPLAPAGGLPRNFGSPPLNSVRGRLPYRRTSRCRRPRRRLPEKRREWPKRRRLCRLTAMPNRPPKVQEVPDQGLLQPVPRSDFNNLFSPTNDGKSMEGKSVKNGSVIPSGGMPK